jgi:Ca-activated chloride channel family protein
VFDEFRFLSPAWLLALLPLGLLLLALSREQGSGGAWRRVVDPRLLAALTVGAEGRPRRWPLVMLGVGWLGAVVALANPTFERVEVPAYRGAAARVVALDLSRSMLADDLRPSRLARAQLKLEDILDRSADGQVGLVVFAGDAFSVVPLTDDAETIRGVLPALTPDVMPTQGSRVDLAIGEALKLLRQGGVRDGEVVLLTDAAGGARARSAATALRQAGHRLAIIGVGTSEGGVVPDVRSARGAVLARLDAGELRALARHGGGTFARIAADDADLRRVLSDAQRAGLRADQAPREAQVWKELGPWLTLALVPFAALGFRRGWLLLPGLLALNLGMAVPEPATAADDPVASAAAAGPGRTESGGFGQYWRDLWQRRDQQAAGALARGDYRRASQLAEDPARSGAAQYRLGAFEAAAAAFAAGDDAQDHYNRGNALARAGQLEAALAAYDEALARQPGMADAVHNRAQVEAALQRPPQQQDQSSAQQEKSEAGGASADESAAQPNNGQGADGQDASQAQAGDQRDADAGDGAGSDAQQDAAADAAQVEPQPGTDAATAPGSDAEAPEQAQAGARPGDDDARADSDPAMPTGAPAGADDAPPSQAAEAARRASEERAAQDYRAEADAADADAGDGTAREPGKDGAEGSSADTSRQIAELERRQAADQWLRRIPDDPAGLLRRKFLYQYQMRPRRSGPPEDPW